MCLMAYFFPFLRIIEKFPVNFEIFASQLQQAQADEDHLHKHTAKLQKAEMQKFKKDQAKEKKQRNEDMKKVLSILLSYNVVL